MEDNSNLKTIGDAKMISSKNGKTWDTKINNLSYTEVLAIEGFIGVINQDRRRKVDS